MPDDWKSMAGVGAGVYEIRLRTGTEHRVFYVAKFEEGIYVLHRLRWEGRTRSTHSRRPDAECRGTSHRHRYHDFRAERDSGGGPCLGRPERCEQPSRCRSSLLQAGGGI
jgi:phage-related protein